jgi:His-Xaa-Ser system protein HxsD
VQHYIAVLGDFRGMAVAAIEIVFDNRLFTPDVIARTAHRYTDAFFVEISLSHDGVLVHLTPKQPSANIEGVTARFRNDALDDRLRARIEEQTRELQATLTDAALRGARLNSAGSVE